MKLKIVMTMQPKHVLILLTSYITFSYQDTQLDEISSKKKKTLVVAAGYFGAMGEVDADAET